MEIVTHSPVVLALTPPRIDAHAELPPPATTPDLLPGSGSEPSNGTASTDAGVAREALRLRVRWVQELTGRAAWELGCRMEAAERLPERGLVRFLDYEELSLLVTRRADIPHGRLRDRESSFTSRDPEPLPARFQVSDRGRPVAVRQGSESGGGTGAGGGTGSGPVTHDTEDPSDGSVLVLRTLAPGIGPLLPRLNGVIAETGSVLAHLAILAREAGVATVVGYAGAVDAFADGDRVIVDGESGLIERRSDDENEGEGDR